MKAGLLKHFTVWEMSYTLQSTKSQTGAAPLDVRTSFGLNTKQKKLPLQYVQHTGLGIMSRISNAGTPAMWATETYHRFWSDILGIDQVITTGAWSASVSSKLLLNNYKLYMFDPGDFYATWDSIEWYVDNVLQYTVPAGELYNREYATPSGAPLIGVSPRFANLAAVNPAPIFGWGTQPPSANSDTSVSCTCTGGWRFKDSDSGSSWVTLPVKLAPLPQPPAVSVNLSTLPSCSATNTFNLSCSANSYYTQTSVDDTYECWECPGGRTAIVPSIHSRRTTTKRYQQRTVGEGNLIPYLDKTVERFEESDYRAYLFRYGTPETKASAFANAWDYGNVIDITEPTESKAVESVVHPMHTTLEGVVKQVDHAVEDIFKLKSYSWWAPAADTWELVDYTDTQITPGTCPVVEGDA